MATALDRTRKRDSKAGAKRKSNAMTRPTKAETGGQAPAVVKKYANRRLYNTATSSYVTLEELGRMVKHGVDFVVYDAKTGEDITRSVLTQIILEEEAKGQNLLPMSFLRQLIGFYDDNMRAVVPRYLEMSMEHFARNQEQVRKYIEGTFGNLFPIAPLNDMARQNMALMQRAATMFSPLPLAEDRREPHSSSEVPEEAEKVAAGEAEAREEEQARLVREVRELRAQIDAMQQQMRELAQRRGGSGE
jgi:polyhydroxyalkanoate synthesis repressor PhaR